MRFMNKKYFKQLRMYIAGLFLIPYFSYFFNIINRVIYHLKCVIFAYVGRLFFLIEFCELKKNYDVNLKA